MRTDYQQQAIDFLTKTGATMEVKFLKSGKHFEDDKEERDIYKVTIKRGARSYSFNFGQSLAHSGFKLIIGSGREIKLDIPDNKRNIYSKKSNLIHFVRLSVYGPFTNKDKLETPVAPNEYNILACLTKYDPGTFEDFCSEFGYDTDSKRAEKTYKAVCDEYMNVCALFSDEELNELQEIQ